MGLLVIAHTFIRNSKGSTKMKVILTLILAISIVAVADNARPPVIPTNMSTKILEIKS